MNVFPTSLASMIDDLRACTHKLPELFPLMALLYPKQLRAPTAPQRRPLKQGGRTASWSRRGTASTHFCGAKPWMPRCGSSAATTACAPTSWPWRTESYRDFFKAGLRLGRLCRTKWKNLTARRWLLLGKMQLSPPMTQVLVGLLVGDKVTESRGPSAMCPAAMTPCPTAPARLPCRKKTQLH